jgi:hypothetical protein
MAVTAVEDAILSGDVKTALVVLKGLGLLNEQRPFIGPTTAGEVQGQWDEVARRKKNEELLRSEFSF